MVSRPATHDSAMHSPVNNGTHIHALLPTPDLQYNRGYSLHPSAPASRRASSGHIGQERCTHPETSSFMKHDAGPTLSSTRREPANMSSSTAPCRPVRCRTARCGHCTDAGLSWNCGNSCSSCRHASPVDPMAFQLNPGPSVDGYLGSL